MRIGIDCRELYGRPTGVGRYLSELLRVWSDPEIGGRHTFVLYSPQQPHANGQQQHIDGRFERRAISGRPGIIWEQVWLPWAANPDELNVFFAPAYTAPLAIHAPLVLTIHDLSFAAHPEWFRMCEGFRRRLSTRMAAQKARLVLTDSEFSAKEIVEHLGVPAERILVVPLGVTRRTTSRHSVPTDKSPDELVLFVGSIFNRRRVPDLIAAFANVARNHPALRLAIVGENRSYPVQDLDAAVAATGLADRVAIHAYVSDNELDALYARARVFVFLSEYEGFGLTPLEALSAGIPVVVLDTPVAHEVYGRAAVFVQPGDIEGTSAAIERLLENAAARTGLLAEADELLRKYSWLRAARQTLSALETAAGPVHDIHSAPL